MLPNLPSSIIPKGWIRWCGCKRGMEMPSFLNCLMKNEWNQWCRESPYKFFKFPISEWIEPVILKDWCGCGVEKSKTGVYCLAYIVKQFIAPKIKNWRNAMPTVMVKQRQIKWNLNSTVSWWVKMRTWNFTTNGLSYFSVCFYWSQQSVTQKNRHSIFYQEQWHLKTKKARQSIHPFMERDRVENNRSRLGDHVCV